MNYITEICRKLRNNATDADRFLLRSLRKRNRWGEKFLRQYPIIVRKGGGLIEFYVADFYCHEAKLLIEVDRGYHQTGSQRTDDELRDRLTGELGLTTLRFTNEEVLGNVSRVIGEIDEYLKAHLLQLSGKD